MKLDLAKNPKWLLIILIVSSIVLRLVNLDNPIIERHGARMTQTAITVQYWLRDGINVFEYQTPILGEPWTIPLEFPIFQLCAFITYKCLDLIGIQNLDEAMRLTNLGFFYGSVCLLFLVAIRFFGDAWKATGAVALYLLVPFSIFWSRSSMIEFTVVFFGLGYIWCFMRFIEKQSPLNIFGAILFGSLGFLTKLPSMLPACLFIAFLGSRYLYEEIRVKKTPLISQKFVPLAVAGFFVVAIPLVLGICWVKWTDHVKTVSGFGFWTSHGASKFFFGTLSQKLDPGSWRGIVEYLDTIVSKELLFLSVVAMLFMLRKPKDLVCALVPGLCAFGTVFVYFNVYYVHDYYFCAILPYLCMSVAFCVFWVIHSLVTRFVKPPFQIPLVVATLAAVLFFIFQPVRTEIYLRPVLTPRYQYFLHEPRKSWGQATKYIRQNFAQDDWLILFDSPPLSGETPYYAQRRSWIIGRFGKITDADPAAVAKYEIGLLNKSMPDYEEQKSVVLPNFELETTIDNWEIYRNQKN